MVFDMVRYKRKRYNRRRSTNVIRMKFQSFMDIATTSDSMQVITISAGGREILKRLAPQFGAYKYYKIGNIACKLVPASTLPCDPSGLSLESDEPGVDPRDQLTPGMMRITNGEDVFENITGLSDSTQHAIYNNMLLDPRWFKWMLQSGVKRHATPRYWQIGQLHQDKWPGSIINYPSASGTQLSGTREYRFAMQSGVGSATGDYGEGSSPRGLFQVGHRGVLGWLPTDGLVSVPKANNLGIVDYPSMASPPEVEVMKIILPKAYKTRYFYRMFITETVYFKEPIVNFGIDDGSGNMYRPLDIFHNMAGPYAWGPASAASSTYPSDYDTGGNYGDD